MVNELLASLEEHPDFIITDYMGSSVLDLELVRKNLRSFSSEYFVVKNAIARVVFDKLKLDEAKPFIDGGIGLSFSGKDIIATCRVLVNFAKDHDKFKIKGAIIDGKFVPVDRVKQLASLPSKEVLLSMALATMMAPISGFANVLSGVLRKFVYCVDAIKKSKVALEPEAAPAAAPEAAATPATEAAPEAAPEPPAAKPDEKAGA